MNAFRYEQSDPARFYGELARDSADQVATFVPLTNATLLDVGGGPGFFRRAFTAHGAHYLCLDTDVGELSGAGEPAAGSMLGSAMALPVRDGAVDVCYSSNVLEHVAQPELMAEEMLRVTRPGGTVVLSYCNWLSPNGGHETGPLHLLLGGRRAAERYTRRNGHRPKNDFGVSLFPVSAARMLAWADRAAAQGRVEQVARLPRYHPAWARWVIDVPGLRELASWNVMLVLRTLPG